MEIKKNIKRASGILLHPTSLPGPYGIGDLGSEAYAFIDLLHDYDQTLWQILPLGQTGYGNSPYQSFSAFAGNPLLISIDLLIKINLLTKSEIKPYESTSLNKIDFGKVINYKLNILGIVYRNFCNSMDEEVLNKFLHFKKENLFWINDFSVFMALKSENNYKSWTEWEPGLRNRKPDILKQWIKEKNYEIEYQKFIQFLFHAQWNTLKTYSNEKGIKIIGDMPIYVSYDSSDVWANRDLFQLDKKGNLTYISGVPPDYFSAVGQKWGNPIYRWNEMEKRDFTWWKERFNFILKLVDYIRLDHFRGYESYWVIKANQKTAINGKWISGPGSSLFKKLLEKFKSLPILAEDLGLITEEVNNLRNEFKFPGMKIFQFGFDEKYNSENLYLPHNYIKNSVVYSGTHDNDTIIGWFNNLSDITKSVVKEYVGIDTQDIFTGILKSCHQSVSIMSIFPFQDILRLDNEARMNYPSRAENNWEWRYTKDGIISSYLKELKKYTILFGRK